MQHQHGAFEIAFRSLFVRCLHRLSADADDTSDVRSNSSQSQVVLTDACAASGLFDSLGGHGGACACVKARPSLSFCNILRRYRGCVFENKHPGRLKLDLSRDVFKRRAAASSNSSVSTSSLTNRLPADSDGAGDGAASLTPAGIGCCVCSDGAVMTGTFSGDSSYGCGYLALGSAGR